MIAHILLVAAREFRQIAATRGFWITMLIVPLAIAAGPVASRYFNESGTERVMLIDATGQEAAAIRARIALDEQRRVLLALSRYAQRHDLGHADPAAPWAQYDRIYSDADVVMFEKSGGVAGAQAQMRRFAAADTPPFKAPEPSYEIVDTPPAIAAAAPDRLDALLEPMLRPSKTDSAVAKPVHYALFVPADFGRGGVAVKLWAKEQPRGGFVQLVQSVLAADLRGGFLQSLGLGTGQIAGLGAVVPTIAIKAPPPGGGRERVVVRSILPLASAYILMMALSLSGAWMLQGVVEERSNKLIEAVLACVSPNELMYGKLVGTVAVGLTMVLVWVSCGVGAAFLSKGAVADFIRPALAPLSSPGVAAAMLFYFLAGYLIYSMVFLAIGVMSDSMRDAQSYLTPVLMLIIMPFALLAQAILQQTGGTAIAVMTWIPFYTPFTMLARLGVGVSLWEIIVTSAMLVGFIVLLGVMLGRIFRASLLAAGQKPSLAAMVRMIRGEQPA